MDLLDVAITAAKKGGEAVLRHFETSVERRVKTDKSFVTAADTEAESVILKEIKNAFPNHSILSEESGAEKQHSP